MTDEKIPIPTIMIGAMPNIAKARVQPLKNATKRPARHMAIEYMIWPHF